MSRGTILLVVVVALAGCTAPLDGAETTDDRTTPTVPAPGTSTDAESDGIRVTGGELPVDPDRTFDRVARLLDADIEPPAVIKIVTPAKRSGPIHSGVPEPLVLLGIAPGQNETRASAYAGVAVSGDEIRLNRRALENETATELLVVHEFVHAIQWRQDAPWRVRSANDVGGPGPEQASEAVIEGTAMVVMDAYADRYLETESSLWIQTYYRSDDPVRRYRVAPYIVGERYVDARFESLANVSTVYTFSPKTTEAVLHQYPHRSEPPAELRISPATDEWTAADEPKRVGELATRIALGTALNESAAAAGADGWGNDRLLRFRNGPRRGYAWALRWDDHENATEFATTFQRYLDIRANRTDDVWRTPSGIAFRFVRTSNRTTVVLFGHPRFVTRTAVDGDTDVTVTAP